MTTAPVIPGPAESSIFDGPNAKCSACGSGVRERTRRGVNGILIMLCNDAKSCCEAYRAGLTPAAYAKVLRTTTQIHQGFVKSEQSSHKS